MADFLDTVFFGLRLHLSGAWRAYACAAAAVIALALLWHAFVAPPAHAAIGIVEVPSGEPVSVIARDLADAGVVRSPFALKLALFASGRARAVQAGEYEFKGPESVFAVARRIATGDTGIVPVRVTLTEGMASFDMARTLAADMPGFDTGAFEALGAQHEGYLFPDTYFFLPTATPQQIVDAMTADFSARTASLMPQVDASGHSLADIVTMASIVQKEANTPQDQAIVAGILWNRIAIGMRLEVDPVFGYLHQEDNYQPTQADLDASSTYNTYRNYGLPPGPISNPGLAAIEAALNPTQTDYLYYIAGSDGTMHYATTFAQHEQNIQEYL